MTIPFEGGIARKHPWLERQLDPGDPRPYVAGGFAVSGVRNGF